MSDDKRAPATRRYMDALVHVLGSRSRLAFQIFTGDQALPAEFLDTRLTGGRGLERRADFLYRDAGGGIVHVEFQTRADATMPVRMFEYRRLIMEQYGVGDEAVRQYVLVAGGGAERRVEEHVVSRYTRFSLTLDDFEALMADGAMESNLLGMFHGGAGDGAFNAILDRVEGMEAGAQREDALLPGGSVAHNIIDKLSDQTVERMRAMGGLNVNLEDNVVFQGALEKYMERKTPEIERRGEKRGEKRGILIGRAECSGATASAIAVIRKWPLNDLDALSDLIDAAIGDGNWDGFALHSR